MARSEKQAQSRVTKDHLDAIEESIEMLKVAYERYFNGVDRVPPVREHEDVKRSIRNLERMRIGATVLRFRAQNLRARLVTYEHYWTRILGMIEKGTFKRVLAVSNRRQRLGIASPETETEAGAGAGSDEGAGEARGEARPQRREARDPAAAASRHQLPDGVDAKYARELYKQFVAAKKAAGEPTAGLTYGKLVDRLAREVPKLREKHGTEIRFEVATVQGKVRLRARRQKAG